MESSRVKSLRTELSKAQDEDHAAAWQKELQIRRDRDAAVKLAVQTWETENPQHKMSLTKIAEELENYKNDTSKARIKDYKEKDSHPKTIDAWQKIEELQWEIRKLKNMIEKWDHENEINVKQHYLNLIESELKYHFRSHIPPYFVVRDNISTNDVGLHARSFCGCAYYYFKGGKYKDHPVSRKRYINGYTESHCHIHLCWYHEQKMDLKTACSIFVTNVNQQGYNISEHKKHSGGDLGRAKYNKPDNEKYVKECRCYTNKKVIYFS